MSWFDSMMFPGMSQEGESKGALKEAGILANTGNWATGLGEKASSKASDFWSTVLNGDSSKISALLAPQIGEAKTAVNQQNKTTSMFNPRSGGTAASTAATDDKFHSWETALVGNLTGSAASNLGQLGSSLLNAGIGSTQAGAGIQTQNQQLHDAAMFGPFWHGG